MGSGGYKIFCVLIVARTNQISVGWTSSTQDQSNWNQRWEGTVLNWMNQSQCDCIRFCTRRSWRWIFESNRRYDILKYWSESEMTINEGAETHGPLKVMVVWDVQRNTKLNVLRSASLLQFPSLVNIPLPPSTVFGPHWSAATRNTFSVFQLPAIRLGCTRQDRIFITWLVSVGIDGITLTWCSWLSNMFEIKLAVVSNWCEH